MFFGSSTVVILRSSTLAISLAIPKPQNICINIANAVITGMELFINTPDSFLAL